LWLPPPAQLVMQFLGLTDDKNVGLSSDVAGRQESTAVLSAISPVDVIDRQTEVSKLSILVVLGCELRVNYRADLMASETAVDVGSPFEEAVVRLVCSTRQIYARASFGYGILRWGSNLERLGAGYPQHTS